MNAKASKKIIVTALAYVGVIVGAGFASGQEILQYYVSFGFEGIWGLIVSAVLFALGGIILLQFGSYYKANEHNEVFVEVTNSWVSKIFDFLINLTLFLIGFVMIAGAGTNLNEQFGWPVWVGSLIISILIIATGFMDVDRVTTLIGTITPLAIIMIVGTAIYSLFASELNFQDAMALSSQVPTTLPNWFISSVNYAAFGLMTAVSMAIVIGGNEYSPRIARNGGAAGGILITILLLMSFIAISLNIPIAADSGMPMLAILNAVHPILGLIMSMVIFLMIYNTGIGMYYPLAKRVTSKHPDKFPHAMIGLVIIGFLLSFFGFETLVAYVYPFIGYIGMIVFAILFIQWIRYRDKFKEEQARREEIFELEIQMHENSNKESAQINKEQEALINDSPAEGKRIKQSVVSVVEDYTSDI